jgi:hypothetical protein
MNFIDRIFYQLPNSAGRCSFLRTPTSDQKLLEQLVNSDRGVIEVPRKPADLPVREFGVEEQLGTAVDSGQWRSQIMDN